MGRSTRRSPSPGQGETSEARDHAVLSSLRDIVLVRDANGILTYCSPSVSDALGYQPTELEGTPARDLIHASDIDARDDLLSGSRDGLSSPPIDVRMRVTDSFFSASRVGTRGLPEL